MPLKREINRDISIIVATLIRRCRHGLFLVTFIAYAFVRAKLSFGHVLLAIRIIEGETRIGIFAISDINKGEHITYDYQ